jgi:hypothetical protein
MFHLIGIVVIMWLTLLIILGVGKALWEIFLVMF